MCAVDQLHCNDCCVVHVLRPCTSVHVAEFCVKYGEAFLSVMDAYTYAHTYTMLHSKDRKTFEMLQNFMVETSCLLFGLKMTVS